MSGPDDESLEAISATQAEEKIQLTNEECGLLMIDPNNSEITLLQLLQKCVDAAEDRVEGQIELSQRLSLKLLDALVNNPDIFSSVQHGEGSSSVSQENPVTIEDVIQNLSNHIQYKQLRATLNQVYSISPERFNGKRNAWQDKRIYNTMKHALASIVARHNRFSVKLIGVLAAAAYTLSCLVSVPLIFGIVLLAKGWTPRKVFYRAQEAFLGEPQLLKVAITEKEHDNLNIYKERNNNKTPCSTELTHSQRDEFANAQGELHRFSFEEPPVPSSENGPQSTTYFMITTKPQHDRYELKATNKQTLEASADSQTAHLEFEKLRDASRLESKETSQRHGLPSCA